MKLSVLSSIIFLLYSFNIFAAKPTQITICTDKNIWYPFTYSEKNQSMGLHVDIVKHALKSLGYEAVFKPLPWKRCLKNLKKGKIQGVVSASYKKKRAKFLHFPEDASTSDKSEQRITQVEYAIVKHKDSNWSFNGKVEDIEEPVRVENGYSIGDDLKEKGVKVDSSNGAKNNLLKLVRDKKGVAITLSQTFEILKQDPKIKDNLLLDPKPLKTKSYFFGISKKANLPDSQRKAFWEAIAKVREDKELMKGFLAKYQ